MRIDTTTTTTTHINTPRDHRANRLPEAPVECALAARLVPLFTGRPAIELAQARDTRRPLANTRSNGTV